MARAKKTTNGETPAAPESAPAVSAPVAAETPASTDGFSRIVSLATLLLVALVAVLAFLNLRNGPNSTAVRSEDGAIATLSQAVSETRADVARVEQKIDALASSDSVPATAPAAATPSEPPPQATPARRAVDRSKCMRVFRSGDRPRWECGR